MTTPKVQYGYANGSANTVRPTTLTYPDGRVLTYGYGTASGIDDASSRIESIIDDDMVSTHLADYEYLGLASFVEVDYTQPDIRYTLVGTDGGNDPDTGDIYRGLDRFGRIKDLYWYDYGSSADVDRIKYGYDRASNRIWRENTVAAALGKHFDELYTNDAIHRVKSLDRGTLTAQKDAVTDAQFAECWSLDPTGNWKNFRQDDDGDGTWDLNQNRTANKVNEISDLTESAGPSWVTPAYSRAGNMTTMPKPADPTASFAATYDAWNRLVKTVEGANAVAENAYDGAKRRIVQKSYLSGVLDETRHLYYTEPSRWQVVEERVNSGNDPERQFVWGLRYIDDLVVRDRDTDANGTLDERLYSMQDANWNVTSIVDTVGAVQERYAYTAYGVPFVLTPAFASRATSNFDWETRYAGYRWDRSVSIYHIRNRVYNAVLGTWLQRDPLALASGMNLLEYARSKPLIAVDPTGEQPWCPAVNAFEQANPGAKRFLDCLCGVVELLDIFSEFLPPIATRAIGAIDCLCNLREPCHCAPGADAVQLGLTLIDCAIDFGLLGAAGPAAMVALIETLLTVLEGIAQNQPAPNNANPLLPLARRLLACF